MKIHEYQAKELLRAYDVPVPRGQVAYTPEEAKSAYEQLGSALAVVKAQIHAGGRGKGGGVKLVRSGEEAHDAAKAILSKPLITHQTGPQGQPVRVLLIEEGSAIAKELYVGLAVDRALGCPVMMASSEGGMDVEEVAATHPEKILKEPVDPSLGLSAYQARRLAFGIGVPAASLGQAVKIMQALARLFIDKDCSIAEINPLILTKDGKVMALDAKMNFDDNALYRHPHLAGYRDLGEEDPREVEASKFGLNYIALEGNIGCMVNGAGLAMGTMDIVQLHGGSPANFLDVGGGARADQVREAFRIILQDKNVQAILVNIFGGIMKCDVIAAGIIEAAKSTKLDVPVVVRLEGTNVKLGREMLAQSGLALIPADGLEDAAKKVVAAAKSAKPRA
ncbi:MAG: ADP-forming succinate--CoA ligase subunit beta [Planctomycetes bacterium]|nr:ADP-forming succinate--CoA ligase subunit beta [Planctomycetota bacterium]